ncbi:MULTISPECIES: thioesterase domain-containing protein [unclassified Saccharopolyspora]|uniref:thioesterase domain-containing protein n=1 Tax=unclassified Saccharopolyspora TaxID=2646250 RepID=UPI001CD3721D|nr:MULTISPECIES: thioesterase domain-containing protein [unclassified Saccharopolyspora]MCA1186211.1 thioester reductase [Saccharopolyspora sp. 6T]MCA1278414.1 thioester reductase [Saccharopolyspora sp. 7B]
MSNVHERVQALSDTKREALKRLLAEKNAGTAILDVAGSNLKALRKGTGPNLYLFPATEGSVGYMNGYLPHIPSEWSVYGCQTPGLDGERSPLGTVEEIAAHNVEQIRLVQPEGPYYLAGNCMGGLPAFETARQLQAAGHEVGLVLHLMPAFDRPWTSLPSAEELQIRGLVDYGFIIGRLLGTTVELPLDEIAAVPEQERADIVARFLAQQDGLSNVGHDLLRHRIDVYQANLGAMFAYQPAGGFDGEVRILTVGSTERGETYMDTNAPYAAVVRGLRPDQVRTTHVDAEASALFDCAEPHISTIGEVLHEVIAHAPSGSTKTRA